MFSKDDKFFLTGGFGGLGKLWTSHGELVQQYRSEWNHVVWNILIDENLTTVLTCGQNSKVKKWSTSGILASRTVHELSKSNDSILAFFEDGITKCFPRTWIDLEEAHQDSGITSYYTSNSQNSMAVLPIPINKTKSVIYLLKSSKDSAFKSVTIDGQFIESAINLQKKMVTLVSAGNDHQCFNWNYQTDDVIPSFKLHKNHPQPTSLTYSEGGHLLVYGSRGAIVIYRCEGQKPIFDTALVTGNSDAKLIGSFAFTSDDRFLVAGSDDGIATLWDLKSYSELQIFPPPRIDIGSVTSCAFSQSNEYVLLTYKTGQAFLFRTQDGIPVQEFTTHGSKGLDAVRAGFNVNGKWVYIQYTNGITLNWKIRESLESFLERGEFDRLTPEQLQEYGLQE